jgi:hypothetical protein
MGKEEDLKTRLVQSIIEYVRQNHKDIIDKAYEYFWDENYPEEFLKGTALEIGFINFEDWLIFDYKVNDDKESFVHLYVRSNNRLKDEELKIIEKARDSVLSLYEVESVSKDKRVLLKDLLRSGEFYLRDKSLARGLKKGDIFATRLLNLDGKHVMSRCVYPYTPSQKKAVLDYVDRQYNRYRKNMDTEGTIEEFLKDYGDVFNIIWMNFILNPPLKET